jgi:hypothetical protein
MRFRLPLYTYRKNALSSGCAATSSMGRHGNVFGVALKISEFF